MNLVSRSELGAHRGINEESAGVPGLECAGVETGQYGTGGVSVDSPKGAREDVGAGDSNVRRCLRLDAGPVNDDMLGSGICRRPIGGLNLALGLGALLPFTTSALILDWPGPECRPL